MEIGPITAIRPITRIKPASPAPDLPGIFAVELRKQAHDEDPAEERAARGLEDEDAGDAPPSDEDDTPPVEVAPDAQPLSRVSFFA